MKFILIALFAFVTLGGCNKPVGLVVHFDYPKNENGLCTDEDKAKCHHVSCDSSKGYRKFGPVSDMCCPVCVRFSTCYNGECTDREVSHKEDQIPKKCPEVTCTDLEIEVVPDHTRGIFCKICVSIVGHPETCKAWRNQLKAEAGKVKEEGTFQGA